MIKKLKVSLIVFFAAAVAHAQLVTRIGYVSDCKIDTWYEISIDSQIIHKLSEQIHPKDASFQFAIPVPVNLTPENSGKLIEKGNELIWLVGIRSKEARSLNLILEPFHIPAGAYVYIYDKEKRVINGAFTEKNNSTSDILPTIPVPGEEIILEYHVPRGIKWKNTLAISQVSHDYIGIAGYDDKKDNRYNLSQPCNSDINCSGGDQYSREKRAVCRLIVRGVELCTGVLLNNTNQQNRPLILTAQHCIVDQNDADRSIFVFGYESPWCVGPDGRVSHSLSGSTLRSTNVNIDFSLVELSTFPPFVYKPYLAGWDISGVIPQNTVAIHHPMGDVKKISIDLNPPVTANFKDYLLNGFWKIIQWDSGTTEGGSSGGPLFDQNKRVVGILTGGEAICGRSVNDYFAKLSVIYSSSLVLYEQLKGWIDPAVSGVKQLDGRDPYAANWLTADTLSNIKKSESRIITKYTLPGSGYSTGFNSDSLTMYAEFFTNPSGRQISEILLNVSKASSIGSADSARVFIFDNGSVPGPILASQKILLKEAKDSFTLKLDFNMTIPVTGNFYIGWKIWYINKAISETRQLAVYHSPDRADPVKNTAWFNDGTGWKQFIQHPFAPMSTSLDVKVVIIGNSVVNSVYKPVNSETDFLIYPNPAKSFIILSSMKDFSEIRISISDMNGNNLRTEQINGKLPGELKVDLSGLVPGLYLVCISSSKYSETHKVLIDR
jgi:lysyl endopeptidase